MLKPRKSLNTKLYNFVFVFVIIFALGSILVTNNDDDIPTDEETWNRCCHHEDCVQGKVEIIYANDDLRTVKFKDYPEFDVDAQVVLPSSNGKEYVCWITYVTDDDGVVIERPTEENTICIFKLYSMVNK